MTAGYEYSPGSRSSTSAASQLLPSRDSATFNGDRPSRVWLYTMSCRPSRSVTASMPESGFGSAVSVSGAQVCPRSLEQVSKTRPDRERPTAYTISRGWMRMLGWMASISGRSPDALGRATVHVRPASTLRSK